MSNGSAAPSDIHPFAIISEVASDSPAQAAGLRDSDQVVVNVLWQGNMQEESMLCSMTLLQICDKDLGCVQVCKFGDSFHRDSDASATLRAIAAELRACLERNAVAC